MSGLLPAMNEQLRAFELSTGIHAACLLAVLALSSGLVPAGRTVALDLSLLGGPEAPAAPDKPLHPRAKFVPGEKAVPAPAAAPEPMRQQVERVNVTADLAPVDAPPGAPAAEPREAPGVSREAARARYTSENFTYIRDRIQRNLVYPQMARKMGWGGRVVVSFVVGTDGCVKEVQVSSSCGHEVLDKSAVETIKRGAPYPAPPVEAELLMPITYRLE